MAVYLKHLNNWKIGFTADANGFILLQLYSVPRIIQVYL